MPIVLYSRQAVLLAYWTRTNCTADNAFASQWTKGSTAVVLDVTRCLAFAATASDASNGLRVFSTFISLHKGAPKLAQMGVFKLHPFWTLLHWVPLPVSSPKVLVWVTGSTCSRMSALSPEPLAGPFGSACLVSVGGISSHRGRNSFLLGFLSFQTAIRDCLTWGASLLVERKAASSL